MEELVLIKLQESPLWPEVIPRIGEDQLKLASELTSENAEVIKAKAFIRDKEAEYSQALQEYHAFAESFEKHEHTLKVKELTHLNSLLGQMRASFYNYKRLSVAYPTEPSLVKEAINSLYRDLHLFTSKEEVDKSKAEIQAENFNTHKHFLSLLDKLNLVIARRRLEIAPQIETLQTEINEFENTEEHQRGVHKLQQLAAVCHSKNQAREAAVDSYFIIADKVRRELLITIQSLVKQP